MIRQIIGRTFKPVGMRFIGNEYNSKEITEARNRVKAANGFANGNPSLALILFNEAIARFVRFEDPKSYPGDELNGLISQREDLAKSVLPNFSEFCKQRLSAYKARRGQLVKYVELYMKWPRAYHKELIVSDLFHLAIFEGSESARSILKTLAINFDNFDSPIIDFKVAKRYNPGNLDMENFRDKDMNPENLALMFYASGLWKEIDGMSFIKTNRMLLYWALQSTDFMTENPNELVGAIKRSFKTGNPSNTAPKNLVFSPKGKFISLWDEKDIRSDISSFIESLQRIKEAIDSISKERLVGNHTALISAELNFIEPSIFALRPFGERG